MELVDTIIASIKLALECPPPEISADIVDQGIALTGEASMLKNLDIIATSVVPLPISTIMAPSGLDTGKSAPIAQLPSVLQ